MKDIKNFIITEGKYGPTGQEAIKIMNSEEFKKYQNICDKYFKLGKEQNIKGVDDYYETIEVRLPQVNDGWTRRLCRHLEYDDKFICIPGSIIYYVINRDEAFSFSVTYAHGAHGSASYVSGEKMCGTHSFSSKKANWVANLIKELNPDTKYTAEDFEAD